MLNRVIHIVFVLLALLPIRSFADSMSDSVNCLHSLNLSWVKTAGSDTLDAATGVCADAGGNVYVTGYFKHNAGFESTEVISGGLKDIYLAKYAPSGELLWVKTAGGSGDDVAAGVVCGTSGDIYITGMFTEYALFGDVELYAYGMQDAFIACYAPDGELKWVEPAGGWQNDWATDIAVGESGDIAITGTFDEAIGIGSTTLLGIGGNDIFIGVFSSLGSFRWAKAIGSLGNDESVAVSFGTQNQVLVSGNFTGNMTLGSQTISASGNLDAFAAVFSNSGAPIWLVSAGTDGNNDKAGGIASDSQGNVYLTGYFDHDDQHAFIRKFNPSGSEEWTKLTGGDSNARLVKAICDVNDYVFAGGYFTGTAVFGNNLFTSLGNNDMVFIKIGPDSEIISVKVAGSGGNDQITDISLDNQQNLLVSALFSNNAFIEGTPYTSNGLTDAAVIRYSRPLSMGNFVFSGIGCSDDNLCAEVNMLQGTEPYTYYWSTGDNTAQVCGLSPASYWLTVVDAGNCFIDTLIVLQPSSIPDIELPPAMNICLWDTVTLDAGSGMVSYHWSTGDNTQQTTITEGGTYSVTVMNQYECEQTASVVVTEGGNIELFSVDTVFTCVGVPVTLSLSGTYSSYLWSTGATTSQTIVNSTGNYYVRVRTGGCYYYDTIPVRNYPQPEINLGGDRVLCRGDVLQLSVDEGFANYLWNNGDVGHSTDIDSEGGVTLTVTDINGCIAYDSIYITEAEYPEVNLGPDLEYCDNLLPVIDAGSGFATYAWSDGSIGQTISPDVSGTYRVTVSNVMGCTASDTIEVVVRPAPVVNLGDDIEACASEEVALSAPLGYTNYLWSTGSEIPILNIDESGTYSLTVTDATGCIAIDTVEVLIFDPVLPSLGLDRIQCDSFPAILDPDGMYESYLWQDESTADIFTALNEGTYSVTVTDENGCTGTDDVRVKHAPSPVLTEDFSASGRIEVSASGGVPPYIYSVDGSVWSPNNVFNNLIEGWYTTYVRDSNACVDTVKVYVDNYIIIPEFFTPNGDGYNDTWEILGMFHYPNADIMIFDRFGKMMAHYKGSDQGWNGTYAFQNAPSDTYWYVIKLNTDSGSNTPYKGSVTLKR